MLKPQTFIMSLCLLGGSLANLVATPQVQHETTNASSGWVDLPALSLTPSDLASAGLEGFGLERGGFVPIEDAASGLVPDPQHAPSLVAAFEQSGWLGRYDLTLARPSVADPFSPDARVTVSVTQFAEDQGALRTLAEFTETNAATPMATDGSESPDAQPTVIPESGAAAWLTRVRDVAGPFLVSITLVSESAVEVDSTLIALLIDLLTDRLTAASETTQPDLSGLTLELALDPEAFAFTDEKYERLDGEMLRLLQESERGLRERQAGYGDATDVYSRYRALDARDGFPEDDPYCVVRLLRFPDEDAASAYLATAGETLAATGGVYERIDPVATMATLGDESVAFTYRFRVGRTLRIEGHVIFARVGDTVARVQLDGAPIPPLAAVETLAAAQVACLEAGECLDAIALPPGVQPTHNDA